VDVLGPVADQLLEYELLSGRHELGDDLAEARRRFQTVIDRTHGYSGRNEATRARALALRGLGQVVERELELARERGDRLGVEAAGDAYRRAAEKFGESSQTYPDLALAQCNWVGTAHAAELAAAALREQRVAAAVYAESARTLYRTALDNPPAGAIVRCTEDAVIGLSRLGP
jgi:hypothetical protein